MRARMLVVAIAWLAACSTGAPVKTEPPQSGGKPMEPAGPAPAANSGGSGSSAAPAPSGPKLGDTCGANDACGEGACVTYYGFAGPRGPQFKSCEIRCDAQGGCQSGYSCITIADGPGRVCRPTGS